MKIVVQYKPLDCLNPTFFVDLHVQKYASRIFLYMVTQKGEYGHDEDDENERYEGTEYVAGADGYSEACWCP